ncbi:type II toxin-antitoxin system RelE family toxin [Micromonospora haikouensis]|uniref:type II toxin-antitoxin system RelE family toxin n=1 Tax=Micromonospora haikouensis TaxID=686309 RepID=UPI003D91D83C
MTPPQVYTVQVDRAPGLLRIRSGSYRIVYTVRDEELIVLVVHLGQRSDVYDAL